MMHPKFLPFIFRQIRRHRVRSLLTISGVGIAAFMFVMVDATRRGVDDVTRVRADDTRLVVYRKDRFCPATSRLPEDYGARIARIDGVASVMPMKVVVNNCRAGLDVVTFRGVDRSLLLEERRDQWVVIDGDLDAWLERSNAVVVGETLARRRGLRAGMSFEAAGISAQVAAIIRSDEPQDANVAYGDLAYIQQASRVGLGVVTQFTVRVHDYTQLEALATGIDVIFASDREPTDTRPEKAFAARVAQDVVELVGFARWLGIGCLLAILALVGNAVVLAMQSRVAEHAVLMTLGFRGHLISRLVIVEGAVLAMIGGGLGAAAAYLLARFGNFAISAEGQSMLVRVDLLTLLPAVGICLLLGAAASLLPALQAVHGSIASRLRAT